MLGPLLSNTKLEEENACVDSDESFVEGIDALALFGRFAEPDHCVNKKNESTYALLPIEMTLLRVLRLHEWLRELAQLEDCPLMYTHETDKFDLIPRSGGHSSSSSSAGDVPTGSSAGIYYKKVTVGGYVLNKIVNTNKRHKLGHQAKNFDPRTNEDLRNHRPQGNRHDQSSKYSNRRYRGGYRSHNPDRSHQHSGDHEAASNRYNKRDSDRSDNQPFKGAKQRGRGPHTYVAPRHCHEVPNSLPTIHKPSPEVAHGGTAYGTTDVVLPPLTFIDTDTDVAVASASAADVMGRQLSKTPSPVTVTAFVAAHSENDSQEEKLKKRLACKLNNGFFWGGICIFGMYNCI